MSKGAVHLSYCFCALREFTGEMTICFLFFTHKMKRQKKECGHNLLFLLTHLHMQPQVLLTELVAACTRGFVYPFSPATLQQEMDQP